MIPVVIRALGTIPKGLVKGLEDHPDYSIIKICQITELPANLRRLAVTQTPVKNYQLMLV